MNLLNNLIFTKDSNLPRIENISIDDVSLYKNFFSNLEFPCAVISNEGEVIFINNSFLNLFNFDSNSNKLGEVFSRILNNKNKSTYKEKFIKNGEELSLKITKVPINDNSNNYIGIIIEDISYNERYQKKLLNEINIDSLTGLYSKKFLKKRLNNYINNNIKFTYLYLDFDKFKLINDGLGEKFGDLVLKKISKKLDKFFSNMESTISRLGSDEFGVLIKDLDDLEVTTNLVQRLINEIGKSMIVDKKEIFVSLSIGVVDGQTISIGGTADEYMRDAEIALHKAKSLGRGKFKVFDKKMYYALLEQCNLELALQRAYINNEFEIFYQPIFSVSKNKIISLETLLRWEHPRLGFVSPSKFISSAEDLGLIRDLDRDTLNKGIKKIIEINKILKTNISISINISALEFSGNSIINLIKKVIHETKINPNLINLEITESVFLSDIQNAIKNMNELKKLGVKITLDDFGTGFASLSYLRKLPIDTLKIDKSFIKEITTDKSALSIIKMLIELGEELDLNIITEGIETKQQFDTISSLRGQNIQGYYLSRPVRGKDIISYLRKGPNLES